jgi:multidrug transporter EmrE-like cation transporter
MKLLDVLLVLLSVSLSSLSQIVLKRGMTSAAIQEVIRDGGVAKAVMAIAMSPSVIGGLACFGLSAVFWLFVLSRIPLSLAYPFVALGIVATVFAGAALFGETTGWQSFAGVLLIVAGVVVVGSAR